MNVETSAESLCIGQVGKCSAIELSIVPKRLTWAFYCCFIYVGLTGS